MRDLRQPNRGVGKRRHREAFANLVGPASVGFELLIEFVSFPLRFVHRGMGTGKCSLPLQQIGQHAIDLTTKRFVADGYSLDSKFGRDRLKLRAVTLLISFHLADAVVGLSLQREQLAQFGQKLEHLLHDRHTWNSSLLTQPTLAA